MDLNFLSGLYLPGRRPHSVSCVSGNVHLFFRALMKYHSPCKVSLLPQPHPEYPEPPHQISILILSTFAVFCYLVG